MNEAQVKHFILVERKKGTSIEELIFILHDNGVPEYEISMCAHRIQRII